MNIAPRELAPLMDVISEKELTEVAKIVFGLHEMWAEANSHESWRTQMTALTMNEIVEGIRQFVLRSRGALIEGATLDGAVEIQQRLEQIDTLCVEIEAKMSHPSRYSLANGMVGHEKEPALHTGPLLRRSSDRRPMTPHFGHQTQPGENKAVEIQPELEESRR